MICSTANACLQSSVVRITQLRAFAVGRSLCSAGWDVISRGVFFFEGTFDSISMTSPPDTGLSFFPCKIFVFSEILVVGLLDYLTAARRTRISGVRRPYGFDHYRLGKHRSYVQPFRVVAFFFKKKKTIPHLPPLGRRTFKV